MNILSLDLGTKTGWAFSDGSRITSGTIDFKNSRYEGGGMKFLKFRKWLTEFKNYVETIDMIVYEEVRARQPSVAADHTYGGLLATLTAWCEHHNLPYQGTPVGTIKKFITGKGNANKAAVMAAVNSKGFQPKDDNEADAIALLLLINAEFNDKI